ncbi:MAG: plasmid stabilization protein [Bacteroidia bacterium]|nr:MAG: plasmid stabilization protein [Bacteroidia bacterium]
MKKYKLFLNKFAEKDLKNSIEYYNEQQQGLDNEFLLEVKAVILRIENNPYQFPKIEKEARKASVNRFPFAVFFVVKEDLISVFSIFHFSRNPNIWKNRIDK